MGMVVRSNIMALNANRQLGMNNSSVSRSLEKLSSGFRINRAGDDASGLAISEKMKAQIKGLETASSNSQDGISLIQTAEGNLTEVHDMLNRMVELAEKSANGTMEAGNKTYGDAGTDRNALQAEMDALAKEIDRIGDSANFNNIKLLDGSLGAPDSFELTQVNTGDPTAAISSTLTLNVPNSGANGPGAVTVSDTTGKNSTVAVKTTGVTAGNESAAWTNGKLEISLVSGSSYSTSEVQAIIDRATGANAQSGQIKLTNTGEAGTGKITGSGWGTQFTTAGKATQNGTVAGVAAAPSTTMDFTGKTAADLDGTKFKYNGKEFTFDASGTSTDANAINLSAATTDALIATAVSTALNANKGANDTVAVAGGTSVKIDTTDANPPSVSASGFGLTLQIGDTSEIFNKMTVSISDMHMNALFDTTALTDAATGTAILQTLDNGSKTLDISEQDKAGAAMTAVKKVINTVSDQRANLGAMQNRLEHTINNLDVTTENMNAANSRIRDTDMAKEMMNYTKMNVLTQAAQAMLAQANQQPQSVLQLLQ